MRRAYEEGWKEGYQKGYKEGFEEGYKKGLLLIADSRYGPLPEWATKKLKQSNIQELTALAQTFFNADTLEEWLNSAD